MELEDHPYPLADESFDGAVMTEVYEHLRDYPIRALEETRRILRPGGSSFHYSERRLPYESSSSCDGEECRVTTR